MKRRKSFLFLLGVGLFLISYSAISFASFTISNHLLNYVGNKRQVTADITPDSSYATDGESLTPAELTMGAIDSFVFVGDPYGIQGTYDYTNEKVKFYALGSSIAVDIYGEVQNGTDLSTGGVGAFKIFVIGN